MPHGPNYTKRFDRSADYAGKILREAMSSDLPVDRPTKFKLVIVLTTAKTPGTGIK